MAVYEYTALNKSGKKLKGLVDAEGSRAARTKLKSQGIFPTQLKESSATAETSKSKDVGAYFRSKKVSAALLGIATRQLATLVGAGMPLVESLKALGDQLDNENLKLVFADVCDRVNEGSTMADALRAHPKVFPPLYPNMIAAGEASGTLEMVLERLADLLEGQAAIKRQLFSALAYPALMLVLCVGVVIILLAYVVPQLTEIFDEQGAILPLPTRIVIASSDFIKSFWWLLLILAVGLGALFKRYRASKAGRMKTDSLLLRLPLLGSVNTKVTTQQVTQTLGTMLKSGVELLTALTIVKNIINNVIVKEAIESVIEGVREGKSLARELDRTGLFPRLVVHMVGIGEKTGQLEAMLLRAAATYQSELGAIISGLTAILNPILILFLAVVVGTILVSVMLPMLEMTSIVG